MNEKTTGLVAGGVARARIRYNLAGVPDSLKLLAARVRGRDRLDEVAAKLENMAAMLTKGLSDRPAVRLEADEATVLVERVDINLALTPAEITVLRVLGGGRLKRFSVKQIVAGVRTIDHTLEDGKIGRAKRKLIALGLARYCAGKDGVTITPMGEAVYRELEGLSD